MIRQATIEDIPRLVEMGRRSLAEGPYAAMLADNPAQTEILAHQVIEKSGKVLVAEENKKIVALLALFVGPHFYSGELTASELMWYVEPEFRQSFTGISLLRAGEALAKTLGAKSMIFTAPTVEVGKAYSQLGYSPIETNYRKVL